MIVSLALLALAATPVDGCHIGVFERVVKDRDSSAPLVVITSAGERFRMYGNDFIDPRQWRSGDRLKICAVSPPPIAIEITDETRGEKIVARHLGRAPRR